MHGVGEVTTDCVCKGPQCSFCQAVFAGNKHVLEEFAVGALGVEEDTGRTVGDVIDMTACTCPKCPACRSMLRGEQPAVCEWACGASL